MSAPQILDIHDITLPSDDRSRARVIAEAFAQYEVLNSHLSELATRCHVSEAELSLEKEIEKSRADLALEIEWVCGKHQGGRAQAHQRNGRGEGGFARMEFLGEPARRHPSPHMARLAGEVMP